MSRRRLPRLTRKSIATALTATAIAAPCGWAAARAVVHNAHGHHSVAVALPDCDRVWVPICDRL